MSLSQPLISVTIVTYNHEKFIGEAVASVLRQTFADFEAVVVDDGSTDRTGEIIRSFSDPRIRYLHQANQGPSGATNTALAACRGKYVAFMAGDDVLHPERLRRQRETYQRGPTRLLFSGVEFIDEEGRPIPADGHPEIVGETRPSRAELLERF